MGRLHLQGLRKAYGEQVVLDGIDLEIADGEFVVFVGPSGCGKTTLLRMIAGLETITAGELTIDGQRANELHPADRGAAMVFQSYALYPHMTVAENMGFALRMAGVGRAERDAAVQRAAATLRITELLQRYPKALSGGQRQRVAIGRAIVRKPTVFLFDEPLSNLDAALRVNMRIELTRLHQELRSTMVYVTHDQVEAMTMGTRIAVFHQGRIAQVGPPLELYARPANTFVAGFLGSPRMNFVPRPEGGAGEAHRALWVALGGARHGGAACAGLRPEHLRLATGADAGDAGSGVRAQLVLVEQFGDAAVLHLRVDGLDELLSAKVEQDLGTLPPGTAVTLRPDAARVHWFDAAGGRIEEAA